LKHNTYRPWTGKVWVALKADVRWKLKNFKRIHAEKINSALRVA